MAGSVLLALFLTPLLLGGFAIFPRVVIHGLIVLGLGAYLVRSGIRGYLPFSPTSLDLALAVFLAFELLSCLRSVNVQASLVEGLRVADGVVLAWLLARLGSRRRVEAGVLALLMGGLVVAGLGWREYLQMWRWMGASDHRIFANFYNPNCLASFLVLLIPLAASILWACRESHPVVVWLQEKAVAGARAKLQLLDGLALVLLVGALILTGSRGGFLAFGAAAVVYFAAWLGLHRENRWRAVVLAMVGAGALLGVILITPLGGRLRESFAGLVHSNQFRLLTWAGTWQMVRHHPLVGTGIGTFKNIFPHYALGGYTEMAHHSFLQIGAEAGVGALAAFLWVLVAAGAECLRALRATQDAVRQALGAGTLAALVAFGLHNLVDYGWYVPATGMTFLALLGLLAAARQTSYREVLILPHRRSFGPVGLGVALVGVGLLSFYFARWGWAERQGQAAKEAANAGNVRAAARLYEEAIRLAPWEGDYHRSLGRLQQARYRTTGELQALEAAFREYQRARALQPTDSRNAEHLADLYREVGGYSQALDWYQRATHWFPRRTRLWLRIGEVHEDLGEKVQAVVAYQRVVELAESPAAQANPLPEYFVDTNYAEALYRLALIDLEWGDQEDARLALEKALQTLDAYFERRPRTAPLLQAIGEYRPEEDRRLKDLRRTAAWKLKMLAEAGAE